MLLPPFVGADQARAHLQALVDAGLGMRTVAAVAGVPRSTVRGVLDGTHPRLRADTAGRILAVTVDARPDGARVDAGPTRELIEQLVDAGRTRAWIARELGMSTPALRLRGPYVTAAKARAIEELARETLGRDESPPAARGAESVLAGHVRSAGVLGRLADGWRARAACAGGSVSHSAFFDDTPEVVDQALAVCAICPVRRECLEFALASRDQGVWGGTTAEERRRMRRRRTGVSAA